MSFGNDSIEARGSSGASGGSGKRVRGYEVLSGQKGSVCGLGKCAIGKSTDSAPGCSGGVALSAAAGFAKGK